MKILIARTDRLGDLLLTTPLGAAIREAFPEAKIHWLVRPYAAPLLENNPEVDGILLEREQPLPELIKEIRAHSFDAAILAFPRWRTVWATFCAGIPKRIGPASKLYSVLFTHRFWQHRSKGLKHEADFNLELLQALGIPFKRQPTRLVLTSDEKASARARLSGHRILFQKPVVVLHPGSGGSSARWPLSLFMQLGDRLQEEGCDVVVTAGAGENYQSVMIDQMKRIPTFISAGSVTLRELAGIFACANLVVSNSTGPLHMAVAVGVPTVSVYSPIPTCHPQRWGPYPAWPEKNPDHGVALAPDDGSPETDIGKIGVDEVLQLCRERLKRRVQGPA